ncbi:hypothetical protein E2C01_083012 [Portunus trituberculatus]|uniref:Uncharacterized protein n=1 Tax=Portunus trituberculatus TaxID=210409 RepID=A0A5B7J0L9_PORTR|nr:hypothetical protein [Portunus trituberculatus]
MPLLPNIKQQTMLGKLPKGNS